MTAPSPQESRSMTDTSSGAAPPMESETPAIETSDVVRAIANARSALSYADPRIEAERRRQLLPSLQAAVDSMGDAVKRGDWDTARASRRRVRKISGELETPATDW
ncbi:MAG: hypothetical protein ACLP8V_08455 [Thermoplasmata archaeon]